MANRPIQIMKGSLQALSHALERRRHPHRFILTDKTPWVEVFRDGIMGLVSRAWLAVARPKKES